MYYISVQNNYFFQPEEFLIAKYSFRSHNTSNRTLCPDKDILETSNQAVKREKLEVKNKMH